MPDPIKPTAVDIERADKWCEDLAHLDPTHELLLILRNDFALHAQQAREQALEEAATEMEVKWGHIVTPELRDAIRALKEQRPC